MQVSTFAPSSTLAPFLRSFTVVETEEEATRTLIPDTGVILGLRYSGFATQLSGEETTVLPDTALTGLRNTVRRVCTSAGGGIVLANFREGAAMSFFREPLHELFSATIELDGLIPSGEIEQVTAQIAYAADHRTRIKRVEQFLLARLEESKQDLLVTAAVRAIRATRGSILISALAKKLGISQDRFEKRFRQAVGASPKQFSSILRLRRVIHGHRPGTNLASLSLDAGYYDQSHFIREFRSATGEAPQRFFRAGDHC